MRQLVIDDAVAGTGCSDLVDFFRANIGVYGWKNKVEFWSHRLINAHDLPQGSSARTALEEIGSRVVDAISREWDEKAMVQASQLVSWPAGTNQDAHTDKFFSDTRFAAILYLNADYSGGATFLEMPDSPVRVTPRTGRLLVFEGSRIVHGVDKVLAGTRYTNAMWLS